MTYEDTERAFTDMVHNRLNRADWRKFYRAFRAGDTHLDVLIPDARGARSFRIAYLNHVAAVRRMCWQPAMLRLTVKNARKRLAHIDRACTPWQRRLP